MSEGKVRGKWKFDFDFFRCVLLGLEGERRIGGAGVGALIGNLYSAEKREN